jgi:hypothetical protein
LKAGAGRGIDDQGGSLIKQATESRAEARRKEVREGKTEKA